MTERRASVKHILVVDDEEAVRYVFGRYLDMAGYRVSTAPGGAEALAQQQADRADLVITDFKMPGMNGDELLRRLRGADAALPAILISANPVDIGPMLDGVLFFQKPVMLDRVVAHLADVFNAPSASRISTPPGVKP
jgi:two-component system chemotaxis response regulator CheY